LKPGTKPSPLALFIRYSARPCRIGSLFVGAMRVALVSLKNFSNALRASFIGAPMAFLLALIRKKPSSEIGHTATDLRFSQASADANCG
jgi:hypothetical protein